MFFLPILSYYSYDDLEKTTFGFLFGGMFFYNANEKDESYFHVIPFYFQKRWNKEELLQTIFPFYWKYKVKDLFISTFLPLYWFYQSPTFYLHHFVPIFGYVEHTKDQKERSYTQWSILYPFFRYNKYKEGDHYELHIAWPFVKIKKHDDYRSLRILPVLWIRKYKTGKSGFVLFGYYKHFDDGKRVYTYWGLAGILHFKWEEKEGVERSITYFLMIYFHRKIPTYEFRYLTPFYITYYGKEDEYSKDYNLIARFITPFYYYWKSVNYENTIIPFLYTDIKEKEQDPTLKGNRYIFYLFIYYYIETKEKIVRFLLPCFYSSEVNDNTAKYKSLWLGPYYSIWYEEDYVLHLFFPFFYYEIVKNPITKMPQKSVLIVLPFYYHNKNIPDKRSYYYILILIYYITEEDPITGKQSYTRIFPIIFLTKKTDYYKLFVFPICYILSEKKDEKLFVSVLLFFWYDKEKTVETIWVFPFYHHHIDTNSQEKTYLIMLFIYYFSKDYKDTNGNPEKDLIVRVLPLIFYSKHEKVYFLLVFPFYYHHINVEKRERSYLVMLLIHYWVHEYTNMSGSAEKDFIVRIYPIVWYSSESHRSDYLLIVPIYYHDINYVSTKRHYLVLLIFHYFSNQITQTDKDITFRIYPLVWYRNDSKRDFLLLFPFYYHDKDNKVLDSEYLILLFIYININYRDPKDTNLFLIIFPILFLSYYSKEKFKFLLMLLYYHDKTKTTLFLIILPIIKYWKDTEKDEVSILSLFTGSYYRHKENYLIKRFGYYRNINEEEDTMYVLLYYRYFKKDLSYYQSFFIPCYYFEDRTDVEKTMYVLPFYYYHKTKDIETQYIILYYKHVDPILNQFCVFPFYFNYKDTKENYDRMVIPLFYIRCKEKDYRWKTICFIWYEYEEDLIKFQCLFPFYFSYIQYFAKGVVKEPEENDVLLEKKHKEFEYTLILIYSNYQHKFEEGKEPDYFKVVFPFLVAKKQSDNTWRLLPLILIFFQLGKDPILVIFPIYFSIETELFKFLFFWFYGSYDKKDETEKHRFYLFFMYWTSYNKNKKMDIETWTYRFGLFLAYRKYEITHDSSEKTSFVFLLYYYFNGFYTKLEETIKKEHLFIFPLLTYYDYRYDADDRKQTIMSPLFTSFKNTKGIFILSWLFTLYEFENIKVVVSLIYFSFENNYSHFEFYKLKLLFFGLLGQEEDYYEGEKKTIWVGFSFIYRSTKDSKTFVSFPFIWYFKNAETKYFWLIPFIMSSGKSDDKTLESYYLVPFLFSLFRIVTDVEQHDISTKGKSFFSNVSKIESFSILLLYLFYSREDNEYDIRIFFILEYCIFRHCIERSPNMNNAHYCYTKSYLLFIYYFKNVAMMSRRLKNYSAKKSPNDPPNFLEETYSSDSSDNYFYFLWLFERISLIAYEKEDQNSLSWFAPFYYKLSRSDDNSSTDSLFVLWFLHPNYTLFSKNKSVSKQGDALSIRTNSYMFLIWNEESSTMGQVIEKSISVLFFFHPFLATFKYKTHTDLGSNVQKRLIYLAPIFMKYRKETDNVVLDYFALFWVFWKYLSLYGQFNTHDKRSGDDEKMLYIGTIYYEIQTVRYFVVKLFYIPISNDLLGLCLYFYKTEKEKGKVPHMNEIYMPLLFYYHISNINGVINSYFNLFWLYVSEDRHVSAIGNQYQKDTNIQTQSEMNYLYVYPLFVKIYEKNSSERKNSFSLFYLNTSGWFAIFFYCKKENKALSQNGELVEIELKETNSSVQIQDVYNGKIEILCYLYTVFDFRIKQLHQQTVHLQVYCFYLFYRQLGLFQFWNVPTKDDNSKERFEGFYILPLFYSYEFFEKERGFSIFWISRYIACFHYRKLKENDQKSMYMFLTFYEDSDKNNYRLYFLWLFHQKASLMEYWNVEENVNGEELKWKGYYIFILLLISSKIDKATQASKEYIVAMFWVGVHWISLIHYSDIHSHKIIYLAFSVLIEKFKDYSSVHLIWIPKKFGENIETAALMKYVNSTLNEDLYYIFYAFPWFMKLEKKDFYDNIKIFSILWLFHSNASLFLHYKNISKNDEKEVEDTYIYLFLAFYLKDIKVDKKSVEYDFYLFWFISHYISLVHRWIYVDQNDSGVLAFLWFRYQKKEKTKEISVIWLIKSYIAYFYYIHEEDVSTKSHLLFFYYSNREKQDDKYQLYLFWFFVKTLALIEYWSYKDHTGFYAFLITKYENFKEKKYNYVCVFWIYGQISLFFYQKENEDVLSYFTLLYSYKYEQKDQNFELEFYLFYFFWKKLALISRYHIKTTTNEEKGITMVLLAKWYSYIEGSDHNSYLSLFWFIHQKFAIFYHSSSEKNELKETLTYLFFIFNKEWNSDGLYKIAVFWLIVRQASFIRFSYEKQDVKILFFPFFKYQRVRGQFSQWCLLPIIPVKYSFQASLLLYKKKVIQKGTETDIGIEDKSSRKQFTRVRFLYAVFVYTLDENSVKTIEFNPFYYSKSDPQYKLNTWRVLGGLFGQEQYLSTKKDKRRKECRLFCCCNILMGEEMV